MAKRMSLFFVVVLFPTEAFYFWGLQMLLCGRNQPDVVGQMWRPEPLPAQPPAPLRVLNSIKRVNSKDISPLKISPKKLPEWTVMRFGIRQLPLCPHLSKKKQKTDLMFASWGNLPFP